MSSDKDLVHTKKVTSFSNSKVWWFTPLHNPLNNLIYESDKSHGADSYLRSKMDKGISICAQVVIVPGRPIKKAPFIKLADVGKFQDFVGATNIHMIFLSKYVILNCYKQQILSFLM